MPDSLIYTMGHRPYCRRAKSLLKSKGRAFTEIQLDVMPLKTDGMIKRSGARMIYGATVRLSPKDLPLTYGDRRKAPGSLLAHRADAVTVGLGLLRSLSN